MNRDRSAARGAASAVTGPRTPAVAVSFLAHGTTAGSFASRIPALQEHLGLSAGELGIALLMVSIGSVTTMQVGALVAHRVGQRAVLLSTLAAWSVLLPLAALAPSLLLLCAALLLSGVAAGNADVAMNALGVRVERRAGRSLMSRLHGLWSVGGIVGAGIGAACAHVGVSAVLQYAGVGALIVLVALCSWPGWAQAAQPDAGRPPGFARPSGRVLVIGAIAFAAVCGEMAGTDWSAVFLRDVVGAGPGAAALGVVAVATAMAVGRLGGDAVVQRFGPVRTVRAGGVVAVLGVLVVLGAPSSWLATVGFGLLGLGVSTVVPLAFAAAGRLGGEHPGQQIAAVATLGYGAGLATPSLIGLVAELSSLRVAFLLAALLLATIAVLAGALRPARADGRA